MKQLGLIALIAIACAVGVAATTPSAQAGLFGGGKKASPSPSPSPSALPTASPEPPSVAIPRLIAKLKANPTDQLAMAQLAAEYLQVNRPDITLQYTQHLLQMGDKTAQVYYYDGFAEEQLGNAAAATYDLEQASNLDPDQPRRARPARRRVHPHESPQRRRAHREARRDVQQDRARGVHDARQRLRGRAALRRRARAVRDRPTTSTRRIRRRSSRSRRRTRSRTTFRWRFRRSRARLAIDPRNIQALVFKADLYAKQHDDAHATDAYDDAVVAAPTDDEKVAIMVA